MSDRKDCGRVKKSCGKKNVSWVKKNVLYVKNINQVQQFPQISKYHFLQLYILIQAKSIDQFP